MLERKDRRDMSGPWRPKAEVVFVSMFNKDASNMIEKINQDIQKIIDSAKEVK